MWDRSASGEVRQAARRRPPARRASSSHQASKGDSRLPPQVGNRKPESEHECQPADPERESVLPVDRESGPIGHRSGRRDIADGEPVETIVRANGRTVRSPRDRPLDGIRGRLPQPDRPRIQGVGRGQAVAQVANHARCFVCGCCSPSSGPALAVGRASAGATTTANASPSRIRRVQWCLLRDDISPPPIGTDSLRSSRRGGQRASSLSLQIALR